MKKNNTVLTAPLFIIAILVLCGAEKLMRDRILNVGGNAFLTVIIVQVMIFIIPAVIFCRIKGNGYVKTFGIKLFAPSKFGSIIASLIVLISGSALIRFAQAYVFNLDNPSFSPFYEYFQYAQDSESVLPIAMAFVITPAICDEFIFRAIIPAEYNGAKFNAVNASVASVVLFATVSQSAELIPIYLLSGTVYCMLVYATGSSLSAFLSHLAFNAYLVFAEKYIFNAIANPANFETSLFTFGTIFLASLGLFFSTLQKMLLKSAVNGTPTPSYLLETTDDNTPDLAASELSNVKRGGVSKNMRGLIEIIFSPTFLLCIAIFLIMIWEL